VAPARTLDWYLSLLTVREIRRYIARSSAIMLAVFVGLVYALISMSEGGMLVLAPLRGGYQFLIVTGSGTGYQSWNYPGLLVLAPWGIVDLPLFGTVAMLFVSGCVALGMTAAALLAVRLVVRRSSAAVAPTSLGALTGLTPAMIALLALGACCSTTAAATAGVGAIALVTGTTTANLLVNNWFLGLFQMVIVWVALLAQEALLISYGDLFGLRAGDPLRSEPTPSPEARRIPVNRWSLVATLARAALLVGGLTWLLSVAAAWTTVGPGSATVALWTDWLWVHLLPSSAAIMLALFPASVGRALVSAGRPVQRGLLRVLLAGSGIVLLLGTPTGLATAGLVGWGNELLGVGGIRSVWGSVVPPTTTAPALLFTWGLQFALLGGTALALGGRPRWVASLTAWSAGRARADVPAPWSETGAAPAG